jgi:hypothetical protein
MIGESSKVARFDSTTSMVLALARHLEGRELRNLGLLPGALEPLGRRAASLVNTLPPRLRVRAYRLAARLGSVRPASLGELDADKAAGWFASHYPEGRRDTVFVGSSNGAAVHLAAALGAPWLPQNFLVAVRHPRMDVDEPRRFMEWAREPARLLLAANPDLRLHHMADPAQDRPMLSEIAYFRLKKLRLGPAYERFLENRLNPGGTILLVDCRLRWPTTSVAERHLFQFGGVGGLSLEEYREGGAAVAEFLRQQGSKRTAWEPPPVNGESPEAEWGFAEELGEDVERFARERGYRVRRIVFEHPQDLAPFQADLYRWWYRRLGRPTDVLLAETFNLVQPYWALRTAAVPFWLTFNKQSDREALEEYAQTSDGLRALHLIVLSHGVKSPGLVTAEQWRDSIRRLAGEGELLGTDDEKHPKDFGTFVQHVPHLRESFARRYPLPEPMSSEAFDEFLAAEGKKHPKVSVTHDTVAG